MAAADPIGNVTQMKLKTSDSLGNEYETQINNARLGVNPAATYTQVDTFARALAGLTTNAYVDTDLITVISVNEVLAE